MEREGELGRLLGRLPPSIEERKADEREGPELRSSLSNSDVGVLAESVER